MFEFPPNVTDGLCVYYCVPVHQIWKSRRTLVATGSLGITNVGPWGLEAVNSGRGASNKNRFGLELGTLRGRKCNFSPNVVERIRTSLAQEG